MFPEVTSRLAEIHTIDSQSQAATLRGYVRKKVVLGHNLGLFPAIIPTENQADSVDGILLRVTDEQLKKLDAFECIDQGMYFKETVDVEHNGQEIKAIAYVCGDPIRSRLQGDWDPEEFRANDLEYYLKNVVE